MKTTLERLQDKCRIVNRRYKAGDDHVGDLFTFEEKHPEISIAIGWDDYQAITKEKAISVFVEAIKKGSEIEISEQSAITKFYIGCRRYNARLPINEFNELKK